MVKWKRISDDDRRRGVLSAVRREDSLVRRVFRNSAFKARRSATVGRELDSHSWLGWWPAGTVIDLLFACLSPMTSQSTHNAIAALEKATQRAWFCGGVPTIVTPQRPALYQDNSTTMCAPPSSPYTVLNSHSAEFAGTISWYFERRARILESERLSDRCASVFRCPSMLFSSSPVLDCSSRRRTSSV